MIRFLQENGVAVGLFVAFIVHWVQMDKKLALLQRDLDWMKVELRKWGFVSPGKSE
jgi:hypothetical protein